MTTVEYRQQIEDLLERPLEPDELIPVASLAELTTAQVAVVELLAPRHVILPLHYLRAVVPDASMKDIRDFSDNMARQVRDRNAARKPWE